MSFVYDLLLVLHFIGLSAILGSYFTVLRNPRWVPGFLHGGLTQIVTGLFMMGLRDAKVVDDEDPVNHAKLMTKLTVVIVLTAIAFMYRRKSPIAPAIIHAIGGLALLNVLIAVFWK